MWGAYLYHVVLHEMFWNLKTWIREPFNREIGERSQGIMSDSPPGKFNLPPPIIDFEIIFENEYYFLTHTENSEVSTPNEK